MDRRDLKALCAGAASAFALAWPLAMHAQQPVKPPRIGVLLFGSDANSPIVDAMLDGLRRRRYSEALRTVSVEYRYAKGRTENLLPAARELVDAKVDLIFAGGDQAITAAKQATSSIPIVMVACDAVSAGLLSNLARPGGNLTGVTCINADLAAKRLQILKEIFPRLARVGVILNPTDLRMQAELSETEKAGRTLKIAIRPVPLARFEDFASSFANAAAARDQALVVTFDSVTYLHRQRLAELAIAHRLATIHNFREYVDAGALLSYGPNLADMWRDATAHVEKIFNGARPGDLPVEQPIKFEMVINLRTARALGITIPQSVLLRADRVIE